MENGKVDMLIEKDNKYLRIQIKTVQIDKKNHKKIPVRKLSHSKTEHKTFLYTKEVIDYFVGVDLETEDVYMIPVAFSSRYKSSIAISTVECFKNNFDFPEIEN